MGTPQQKCTLNIRHILHDQLKIEAIYYGFLGTPYSICDRKKRDIEGSQDDLQTGSYLRDGAFVITDMKSIATADVKVFIAQTTDDIEDRLTAKFRRIDRPRPA